MTLSTAAIRLFLGAAPLCTLACFGEAGVFYKGTVVEAPRAGHFFSPSPNPKGEKVVPNATVSLGVHESCTKKPDASTHTDAQGHFRTPDVGFGAIPFAKTRVSLCISKPGYDNYVYSTVYEDMRDPSEDMAFINVRLKPVDTKR
jgi:hypothetical protein